MKAVRVAAFAAGFACFVATAQSAPLTVIGFNVESGSDTDPQKIAQDIVDIGAGIHIFGLSEVPDSPNVVQTYAAAAGHAQGQGRPPYRPLVSQTGGQDRTVILFDGQRLDLTGGPYEYARAIVQACGQKPLSQFRAPFAAKFRDKQAPQREFIFFVNHLQRGDNDYRHCQAQWLNGLARAYTIPMIATGDFNFDWSLKPNDQNETQVAAGSVCGRSAFMGPKHDVGYDRMTADGRWCWVMPPTLIKTQCAQSYDGVLDFVFVANRAKNWARGSEILRREANYCARDGQGWSDHRPVRGNFQIQ